VVCNSSEDADPKQCSVYSDRVQKLKDLVNYKEQPEKFVRNKKKPTDVGDGLLKEIKLIATRNELFDGDDSSGLRKRGVGDGAENLEKYYTNIQEKLGDEMLMITKNLKEQTLTASKIIKKDTEIVTKSTKLAHKSQGSLEKESKKLDEHTKRACKCWLWMMIGLVIVIFMGKSARVLIDSQPSLTPAHFYFQLWFYS
jgi:unconventional SNARE in the endoplasmic reticulum protein 1